MEDDDTEYQHCLLASVTESGFQITAERSQVCFTCPWTLEDRQVQGVPSLQIQTHLLAEVIQSVPNFFK